jgi:hypothetical protein
MLYSLTLVTALQEGLWCDSASNCDFSWGGMFTTTSVKELLFGGFTEPAILKYLELKYAAFNVSFECVNAPYDNCGVKSYHCDSVNGMLMRLPNNQSFLFHQNSTSKDLFFSPSFFVNTASGELLFPYARNATLVATAKETLMNSSQTTIVYSDRIEEFLAYNTSYTDVLVVEIRNPFWSAFPAWTETDPDLLKYFECQKRIGFGSPNLLQTCEIRLNTGVRVVKNAMDLELFYGNESVFSAFNNSFSIVNGSTEHNQYQMYFWPGFLAYPYSYLGTKAGMDQLSMSFPSVFNKLFGFGLTLSQSSLIYSFQRDLVLPIPLPTTSTFSSALAVSSPLSLPVRRFVENSASWKRYQQLGTPLDSLTMPYKIPIGFSSLQKFAEFPLFVETPHSYGNKLWGGLEYTFVSGTSQNDYTQRTFVDYDPVTGRGLRSGLRSQVSNHSDLCILFS